ncbi:MAG: hypothetical protein LIP03_12040 [Bacteroidales bacterium]|nr:hypothetical protein [Bacteroidales bacterium]
MIKNLLLTAALVGFGSLCAQADTVTLWESSSATGDLLDWSAQIEGTVFSAGECSTFQAGDKLLFTVASIDKTINEWPQILLKDGNWADLGSNVGLWDVTDFPYEASITLSDDMVTTMKELGFFPSGCAAYITKMEREVANAETINILWEGSEAVSGWGQQGVISSSTLKAGDALKYTFSDAGADGQAIVKGSDWNNLLGTSKMNQTDLNTLEVIVGVTQEMLDNCGGSLFLSGTGGAVLTQIERVPDAFDAESMVVYGSRIPGVQSFTLLDTDAEALAVTFSAAPSWAQLCNSSWADLELANVTTENADGTVTITYTLTADAIAAINANKEFVINADSEVTVEQVAVASASSQSVAAALYLVGDFNSWNLSDPTVVTVTDGVATFTLSTQEFKMSTTWVEEDSDWSIFNGGALTTANYGAVEGENELVNGDWNIVPPYSAEWTCTVDLNAMTITLATEAERPVYDIYLRGSMNDWSAADDWKLTTENGIYYQLEGVTLEAYVEWKIADANWSSINYGYDQSLLPTGEWVAMNYGGSNCYLAETLTNANVLFNIETASILVYGSTEGISSVAADNAAATYYNLQGVEVANPVAGRVYIMRQGNKVSKVIVR